jgi:hypothetical protein
MFVTMKRQVFDSLDPAVLAWECIGPIALPLRGKHPSMKSQVYAQLTAGQQALFVVQVLYNHAGQEAADLYCWVSTLLRDPHAWGAIKAGVCYFGDEAMLHLLEQVESVLEARHPQSDTQRRDALPWDLEDDPELFTSMSQLNATFHELAQASLKLMGDYIRKNPSEFVLIEE